ncbi:hypothetical protein [Candidatus Nanohalobium constans]|uniref:Uncharacterized protein n=1 Tax=Candidatus Nanohalobium constans TaxID=2565781 RepID=A0A5Q0UHA8_9ARCH|nr:hypothetical protein [Candidatus Nanohalobium constans]QGA80600.1 hypothetical protein LC1Nh_0711 [Candidatus Nanohalobium constans]
MKKHPTYSDMTLLREKLWENIFRPSGRRKVSIVYFMGAALFLWMHLFVDDSLFTLIMFTGMFLTGLSEFIPEKKNLAAGFLRIAAIILYLSIIALTILKPGTII